MSETVSKGAPMAVLENHVLYYRPTCPYCVKVLSALDSLGLSVQQRNVSADQGAADDLLGAGGKLQVPCLVIDGKAMYESSDIIAYLRTQA
ncbi:glutaredoxin family protein [Berryella wangjianweii]|uniref:glutaredoxin family protein n=1 Tax=Berryella wangjianweii TaxID=2734634 RepID=UPI0021BDA643|nr:glutathione S-transferase N-terminal domain-containing protein [Berryella wangjianweii]